MSVRESPGEGVGWTTSSVVTLADNGFSRPLISGEADTFDSTVGAVGLEPVTPIMELFSEEELGLKLSECADEGLETTPDGDGETVGWPAVISSSSSHENTLSEDVFVAVRLLSGESV